MNDLVEFRGQTVCLSEAAEMSGIPYAVVQKRVASPLNWDIETALTTPVRTKLPKGQTKNQKRPMTNALGFKGVKKSRGRFKARCLIDGKRSESQPFNTPEEAYAAYQSLTQTKKRGPRPLHST
jgi:hypothetical protein